MILYNITVSVNIECTKAWLEYMINEHIPEVMKTGYFRDYKLCRVQGDEQGGETYAVQYLAFSADAFNAYNTNCAPAIQADFLKKWGSKAAVFRTILPVLFEGQSTTKNNG